MAKLQVTLTDGREETFDLIEETHTVGRHTENSFVIEDVSVSGRHAKLVRAGEDYRVEDVGSTNGTRVNGEPLKAAQLLGDGDAVRFGKVEAIYHSKTKGSARPMPEAEKVEARVSEGTHRPENFTNASPFRKRQKAGDPVGRAVLGLALAALAALLFAVLRTLLLAPPV